MVVLVFLLPFGAEDSGAERFDIFLVDLRFPLPLPVVFFLFLVVPRVLASCRVNDLESFLGGSVAGFLECLGGDLRDVETVEK